MNFSEVGIGPAMDKQYVGQQNTYQAGAVLMPNAPMDTLSNITGESTKAAHELCSLLRSIADAIGGPIPESATKNGSDLTSVKSAASELRSLILQALGHAQRIGSHL